MCRKNGIIGQQTVVNSHYSTLLLSLSPKKFSPHESPCRHQPYLYQGYNILSLYWYCSGWWQYTLVSQDQFIFGSKGSTIGALWWVGGLYFIVSLLVWYHITISCYWHMFCQESSTAALLLPYCCLAGQEVSAMFFLGDQSMDHIFIGTTLASICTGKYVSMRWYVSYQSIVGLVEV